MPLLYKEATSGNEDMLHEAGFFFFNSTFLHQKDWKPTVTLVQSKSDLKYIFLCHLLLLHPPAVSESVSSLDGVLASRLQQW
jgi:hypothetical protein